MSANLIGDYRLLQELGEGAAGKVYLATPTKEKPFAKPGDPLAVKVYKPEILRQASQLERIQREFTVGATLSHPGLVRMHEYSLGERTHEPFLAMEYVDGITLDAWLHMFYPISGRLLLRIVDQIIDALIELHAHRVIHRDLKPQNIMLSSEFEPKIMDFGVVRVTSDTPITPKDKFVGTIRNSSPEMLFGRDYDLRTDLYSLGTVFYSLLYGDQVFAEESQFARLIDLVKSVTPELDLSVASRDELSAALLDITRKLLAKNADHRFQDALAVKATLEPIRAILPPTSNVEPLHGYIATALTGLDTDTRDAIVFTSSRIADVAKDYHLYVYQPRKATDPLMHPDVDPTAVYILDRKRVLRADVLLVLANKPSFGVGQELEIASSYGKPTILIAREGTKISRMVIGSFTNMLDEIVYRTPEDLAQKLRRSLSRNLEAVRAFKRNYDSRVRLDLGQRIASLRAEAGYSTLEEFAAALGLSPRMMRAVENGDYENIGLVPLAQICKCLGLAVRDLFESAAVAPRASKSDSNLARLEVLASKLGWSAGDYFSLREDYVKQVAASGEPARITDEQWTARRNALEQRRLKTVDLHTPEAPEQAKLL